ncbi:DUF1430 domain-containing protein [Listeria booriae]|nr:DUF1430 domain-containing protein [Listeria booriae]
MRIINKVILVIFLLYISTMVIGIQQDGKLFNIEKEASVIVEKKANSEDSKKTIDKLKKMATNENLTIYTYTIAETNVKTYYFLIPKAFNELKQVITKQGKVDYDNRNRIVISENGISEHKIHALYVLGEDGQRITEALLNQYGLNYGIADVHFEDNSLKAIFNKYVMLIIILFIITITSIYLDIRVRRRHFYLMHLIGMHFKVIFREIILKHSMKEFGIGLAIALTFMLLFYPLTAVAISFGIVTSFLVIAYFISSCILYHWYHQQRLLPSRFIKNKKFIRCMQVIYTLVIAVMLLNLAQITHFMISSNNVKESFEINAKVYSMVDATVGLTIEEEKKISEAINDKLMAKYVLYQPIFSKEGTSETRLEEDVSDSTYAGYAVNRNYLAQYKLVPEKEQNTIFIPYTLKSKIPQFKDQLKSMRMEAEVIVYDDEAIEFNTFDPQDSLQKSLILIYEPNQVITNNSFYFHGEDTQILQDKINSIYKNLGISNISELTSFKDNNLAYYYQMLSELSNFIVLGAAFLFSSIYLIIFIVREFFSVYKRAFMLQVLYGRSTFSISKQLILIFALSQLIGTSMAMIINNEFLTTAIWSLGLLCVQLLIIFITINRLMYKSIPSFLKGDE